MSTNNIIARALGHRDGASDVAGGSGTSTSSHVLQSVRNDIGASDLPGLHDRALSLAGIGVWECELATQALTWTNEVFAIFGLPLQSKLDRRDIVSMYCEESRETMERLRANAIEQRRGFSMEARILRADGEHRWMRLTAGTLVSHGRPAKLYGIKQDITEERERWEAMRRLAEQDALTGLASRAMFQTRFLGASQSAPAIAPLGALVIVDVDGFKQVNDSWGHAAGDACLQAVARRLMSGFPDTLMIARIGGDEFAVLTKAGQPVAALEAGVRRLLPGLAAPVPWQGRLLSVSASVGIATVDEPTSYDPEMLFAAADAALYRAKQAGRNAFRIAGCHGLSCQT